MTLPTLGLVFGAAFASGLNLYATVAALGLLHRFGLATLPPSLEVLAHPVVLTVAIALYVVEFVADKVPYVDNVWDVVHTFIRPPAAAVLAYSALVHVPEAWRVAAALLAGGVALTAHGTKASTRVAANASPEPFSNWVLSLGEDGLALALVWLALRHPLWTLATVALLLALSILLLVKLGGLARRALRRALGREATSSAAADRGEKRERRVVP
jgi:hypothetical protein